MSRPRALGCLVLLLVFAGAADAQQCLHGPGESASERSRREAAIDFVDRVNAAQKAAQDERGTYVALADAVSPGDVPLGFVPRVTVDRWSYAVSLKDLFDPCGFALFSDQDGRVYEAQPVSRDAADRDRGGDSDGESVELPAAPGPRALPSAVEDPGAADPTPRAGAHADGPADAGRLRREGART